jgi:hypothetical protein
LLNDDSDEDLIPELQSNYSEDETQGIGMESNACETSRHAIPVIVQLLHHLQQT